MKVLRNAPGSIPASIEIWEDTPEWSVAYVTWLAGKDPTPDLRWKGNVFMCQMDRLVELKAPVEAAVWSTATQRQMITVQPGVYSVRYDARRGDEETVVVGAHGTLILSTSFGPTPLKTALGL